MAEESRAEGARWNGSGMITLPKWLWVLMGSCVVWAGCVTIQFTTLSAQLDGIAAAVDGNKAVIEMMRSQEVQRATRAVQVGLLQSDLEKLEDRLDRMEGR